MISRIFFNLFVMNKVDRFTKLVEDLLLEIYIGEKENFQLELRNRLNGKFDKEELRGIMDSLRENKKSVMSDFYSRSRRMEFYQKKYIPFLKSIQNQIDKSKLEKYKIEIQNAKDIYDENLKEYHEEQILRFEKDAIESKMAENQKNGNLAESIKRSDDLLAFSQLIPAINLLRHRDGFPMEHFNLLVQNFGDIYENNKEKLLEYEVEVMRISLEKISSIMMVKGGGIVSPTRNPDDMKFNDTIAILLIE